MVEAIKIVFANMSVVSIFPVAVIFFIILFYFYYIRVMQPERGTTEWIHIKTSADDRKLTFFNNRYPLTSSDIIPIVAITFVFVLLAIFNLGSTSPVDVTAEIVLMQQGGLSSGSNHFSNLYFDEIYFVRTAVEHIEGIIPYEITHPPLGKNIIAASILAFGMSPFGWRIIGAVCSALMLVVMYIFVKNMFGKTPIAVCASLLLGFDFLRLVQSRIGTIDTFAVLFILLAYYFMYRHITTQPDAPFKKSLPSLALSGFFFGLSFAVKWIGFYAGAGLLIIYVFRLVALGTHYSNNEKSGFNKYLTKTLLYSVLFFVIIPAICYYLSYIPYGLARGMTLGDGMLTNPYFFDIVWRNQGDMFKYHSQLDAVHGGSSFWWQWIFNIKPILYVNNYMGNFRSVYGAFGNPVLYWGGIAAMVIMGMRVFTHRDGKALFILIGYLAQLLPWVAVTRVVFAYHYLPSSMFVVLAMALIFNAIFERNKRGSKFYVYGYTAVSGGAFALFYPMLSGMFMPHWYFSTFVKWLPSWPF